MQVLDTMGRDGPTGSDAHPPSRSFRSTIAASSRPILALACVAVVASILTAASPIVPIASALPVAVLVAPALVDLLDRRLPNRMVGTAALVGVTAGAITVVTGGDISSTGALLGVAVFAGPLLAMHLIAPASMGFGDVKVACVLGAAIGLVHPYHALVALCVGSLLGATAGLLRRRRTIAFGPALVAGAIVALAVAASPFALEGVRDDHTIEDVRT